MEDHKAIACFEAAEAHYEDVLAAERRRDMDDQKSIAFPEAAEAHYTPMSATRDGRASEQSGGMATSTVTRQRDEKGTMSSSKPSEDKPFPFMKLALELRSKVYKEHLIVPGTITMSYCEKIVRRVECDEHEPPHLKVERIDLSVCKLWAVSKTVYYESVPVFFRYNSFHYECLTNLSSFLTCIGPTARRNLTSVSIQYTGKAPAKAMKLLKECVGLRHLAIEITRGSLRLMPHSSPCSQFDVMRMYGLTDLLKVRGIEKLVVTASPNLLHYFRDVYECVPLLEKALQVLKQPHSRDRLKRQENKDYPQKATRTVFGRANVETRIEKKLMAALSTSPP